MAASSLPGGKQPEILHQIFWEIHWGGLGNPHGGLEGRLTKCRLGTVIFHVRENIIPSGGHFQVSAGERVGWKRGRLSRRHIQVLELLAPQEEWSRLAALVHKLDALKPPVRKNRRFTWKWAERTFDESNQRKEQRMPMKLNVGLSRKMGESNYGSRGASVNVEIEVESALAGDSARLRERIRQVFGLVRDSLAEELGNGSSAAVESQASAATAGNGQPKNGNAPRAATQSQVKALFAITKSQGLNLNQLLRERFRIGKPEQLSIREASQLIDELKSSESREEG